MPRPKAVWHLTILPDATIPTWLLIAEIPNAFHAGDDNIYQRHAKAEGRMTSHYNLRIRSRPQRASQIGM